MLLGISKRLKQSSMETDLDDPEAVKEHIAKILENENSPLFFSLLCRGYIAPPIYSSNIENRTCGA